MKPSEYGGADTVKTNGIQPFPHVLKPEEELRLMHQTDPSDEAGIVDPTRKA